MAFSNTFDTTNPGSAVSNREELTDVLTILAPEETPVLSSASKKKSGATFTEWTVDALSAPSTAGVREGADVGQTIGDDADPGFIDKFSGRARLGNRIQKFRRYYRMWRGLSDKGTPEDGSEFQLPMLKWLRTKVNCQTDFRWVNSLSQLPS